MNAPTMHEVTCFHCANAVRITPDATTCSVCGEDLQHLLPVDATIDYFRERALGLSAEGNGTAALAEVERGLTFAESSDLHLLAAILAEKLERFDQMRRHVAAIPVDDTLRGEAEWLLRAHQDRQRVQREMAQATAAARGKGAAKPALSPAQSASHTSAMLDDLLGRTEGDAAAKRRTVWSALATVALMAAAGAVVVTSWWWFGPGALPDRVENQRAADDLAAGDPNVNDSAVGDLTAGDSTADGLAADAPVQGESASDAGLDMAQAGAEKQGAAAVVATGQSQGEGMAAGVAPTAAVQQLLLPTPTPTPLPTAAATPAETPVVPPDLVLVPTESPELADASVRSVVVVQSQIFDLDTFLREQGRDDLANLPVEAQLQEGDLILQGVVNLDLQRRQLIELLKAVPGITRVVTVDLLLRPLPTYTVQEGDTLWSIVFAIYGNVDRLDEFYRYNLDVLPAQDALAPGMQLKVLPIQ